MNDEPATSPRSRSTTRSAGPGRPRPITAAGRAAGHRHVLRLPRLGLARRTTRTGGTPRTTPRRPAWSPAATPHDGAVPNQDDYVYDGLGRAVQDVSSEYATTVVSTTTTVYNGDRDHRHPAGGRGDQDHRRPTRSAAPARLTSTPPPRPWSPRPTRSPAPGTSPAAPPPPPATATTGTATRPPITDAAGDTLDIDVQPARPGDRQDRPDGRHHHHDLRRRRQPRSRPPTPAATPSPTPTTR